MSYRVVRGLRWARATERPEAMPKNRPRGAKRQGVLYERAVAVALGDDWQRGQWWEFEDDFGHGFCQTDLHSTSASVSASEVVVLEVKLSWVPEAFCQLEYLYRPVVEMALGRRVRAVVVTKRLVRGMGLPGRTLAVAATLDEALERARPGREVVLHWLGTGAIRRPTHQFKNVLERRVV